MTVFSLNISSCSNNQQTVRDLILLSVVDKINARHTENPNIQTLHKKQKTKCSLVGENYSGGKYSPSSQNKVSLFSWEDEIFIHLCLMTCDFQTLS